MTVDYNNVICQECHMHVGHVAEYHPYTYCQYYLAAEDKEKASRELKKLSGYKAEPTQRNLETIVYPASEQQLTKPNNDVVTNKENT